MIPKVALCYIVKGTDDEAALLEKSLKSVSKFVDGIYIDVNAPIGKTPSKKVLSVAKKYSKNVKETVWENNFAKARNDVFLRVPNDFDFILWLDTDDTIQNPEKIRDVAAITPDDVDGIYICYDYDHDEYGNVTVAHYVARMVRNNGTFRWKSSFSDNEITVHETLNEIRAVSKAMNNEFKVIHHSDGERRDSSLRRNIMLLEKMYESSEENPDPRILYYLATHYYDAGFFDRTKMLLEQYLTMSGWAEERAQAWVYLGDIYKMNRKNGEARGCYMKALAENPDDVLPYVELGELELSERLWEKAITWLEMAVSKEQKQTSMVMRPLEGTYRAYKALTEAYTNLGGKGLKKASRWLKKALELRPFDPELQNARKIVEGLQLISEETDSVRTIIKALVSGKEEKKILGFLDNLPEKLQVSPLVTSIRRKYIAPKDWGEKSIVIYCGGSALGTWGPWSLKDGIGGSEEAVVQMSKELISLGYAVTVYATPGEMAGEHDGVYWKHYWEFNPKDKFGTLIGWRVPDFFDVVYEARKKYLWLHDVIDEEELFDKRLKNIDKIIFVSKYHADLYKDVPDEKKFVSANGIDPYQFNWQSENINRNNKKVIYMSAHERGQDVLQLIWPDILKEVPDAEAHCYYGWSGFDAINRDNPERMHWKDALIKQASSLKNFTDHGKIGHIDIVKEILSAGIWAYPTSFPEVSCITAMKAQAGGAWPVYTNFAALKTTVKYGDSVDGVEENAKTHAGYMNDKNIEEFKQKLIYRLKNPIADEERAKMMKDARGNMTWRSVANSWKEEIEK